MKYLSLFTGIGGFEIGIQKAYVETTHRKQNRKGKADQEENAERGERLECKERQSARATQGQSGQHAINGSDEGKPTCVGYSEINKYATQIYQNHFPNHKNYGDITKINEKELPNFDMLVGGFPCQAFSIAGKRRGFEDTRGTLFFDIARILRTKRPRLLLLENVKGLLSHDSGRTFKTIVSTLTELGYDLQWQVLNSKNHGVPQNRERILIVGHLRGTPRPEVFPIGASDRGTDETRSEAREEVANTIKAKQGGPDLENSYEIIQKSPDWREDGTLRTYKKTAPTIRANMGDNHPMILQRGRGKNTGGVHKICPTVSANSFQDNNHLISKTVRSGGRASPHGSKQNWDSYEVNGTIRRLTPMECERLQGFPDNWTAIGVEYDPHMEIRQAVGISDTQRYKCLGNAVTTNVIRDVVERMIQ